MTGAAVEDDDFVAAGAAHQPGRVGPAGAFDHDLHRSAHAVAVTAASDGVDFVQHSGVALFFYVVWNLGGHGGGGGVFARGVFEEVGIVELRFADEGERFVEILVGLAGEAGDDIGGHADGGADVAQLADNLEVARAGVAAMHQLQDAVAAALHGQMRAFAQLGQAPIGLDQIVSVAFGMGRGEADALDALDFVDGLEQLHESGFSVHGFEVALAVAGDDLAEEGDFLDAVAGQLAAFGQDVGDAAAAFFTAGVGDDAKGAVLIAALHDAD